MERIAVIGNVAGGKSSYARVLAQRTGLPHVELDRHVLDAGFRFRPDADARHAALLAQEQWVIDGLGKPVSIPPRLERATAIVLIDLPLWLHYALAAERQTKWQMGQLLNAPGHFGRAPATKHLFLYMWQMHCELMPQVRALCAKAESEGKSLTRITSWEDFEACLAGIPGITRVPQASPDSFA